MSEKCAVVKIKAPHLIGGFCLINESDYDARQHELYSDAKPEIKQVAQDVQPLNTEQVEQVEQVEVKRRGRPARK